MNISQLLILRNKIQGKIFITRGEKKKKERKKLRVSDGSVTEMVDIAPAFWKASSPIQVTAPSPSTHRHVVYVPYL